MADNFFPWAQGGPYEAARRRDSASAAKIVCSSPDMSEWCSETIFKVVSGKSQIRDFRDFLGGPNWKVMCLQTRHLLCLQTRHLLCQQTRHLLCQQTSPKTSPPHSAQRGGREAAAPLSTMPGGCLGRCLLTRQMSCLLTQQMSCLQTQQMSCLQTQCLCGGLESLCGSLESPCGGLGSPCGCLESPAPNQVRPCSQQVRPCS